MREIKFRAWDKVEKLMAYDVQDEYDTITGVVYWKDGKPLDREPGESSFGSYLNGKYELMQYTGLLDKNGVPIYEGDIVKYQGRKFEIRWSSENCRFEGWYYPGILGMYLYMMYGPDYEVIGNIYENPDLLK